MLQVNFLLLKRFVELEQPFSYINWEEDEHLSEVGKEIKALYDWWTVERPRKRQELEGEWATIKAPEFIPLGDGGYTIKNDSRARKLLKKERMLDREDDKMLMRLVKIRHHLWT